MTTTARPRPDQSIRFVREGVCYICKQDIAWGDPHWVHPTGVIGHIGHTREEFERAEPKG